MSVVLEAFEVGEWNDNLVIGSPRKWERSKIVFDGTGNRVEISDKARVIGLDISFRGNASSVYIGVSSSPKGSIEIGWGCKLKIGDRLQTTNKSVYRLAEATDISIGDDCLFASNVQIRTHDSHPIFDADTMERINSSKSITIGNRVWLGVNSSVMKGVTIGDGCVIGMNSVVTTDIPENCIAVGSPARVVRRNIRWDKTNLTRSELGFTN